MYYVHGKRGLAQFYVLVGITFPFKVRLAPPPPTPPHPFQLIRGYRKFLKIIALHDKPHPIEVSSNN